MRDLLGSVRSATRGDTVTSPLPSPPLDKRKMQHGCVTQILARGVACGIGIPTPTVMYTAVY